MFECFRFFRSENRDVDTSVLKIWKSEKLQPQTENLKLRHDFQFFSLIYSQSILWRAPHPNQLKPLVHSRNKTISPHLLNPSDILLNFLSKSTRVRLPTKSALQISLDFVSLWFRKKEDVWFGFYDFASKVKVGSERIVTDIMHSQAQTITTLFGANAYGLHTGIQPRNVAKWFPCRFFRRKIRMILIANLKKFLQILQFSEALFESNLKTDVTNLEPHASRTHLKIWKVRDSNRLFLNIWNTPIFWASDFQIWRFWSSQKRP